MANLQAATAPAAPAPDPRLDSYLQRWKQIGLATGSAQRSDAESALKQVYAAAGLDAPRRIIWTGSPFTQGLVRAIVLDPEFLVQVVRHTWKGVLNPDRTELQPMIAESFRSSMRLFDTAAVKTTLYDKIKQEVRRAMTERWVASMAPAARTSATAAVWDSVWSGVWESVGDCLWRGIDSGMRKMGGTPDKDALRTCIGGALQAGVGKDVKIRVWEDQMDLAWANIRNSMSSQERVQAWEGLWKTLQASVWQNVAVPIGEQVKSCGNNSAQSSGYGQHDAYWLAFYDYFRNAHGRIGETEPVAALLALAPLAGWFAPHEHICWVSERPASLSLDDKGQLHAVGEPALRYPDGWSLHARAGVPQAAAVLHPA